MTASGRYASDGRRLAIVLPEDAEEAASIAAAAYGRLGLGLLRELSRHAFVSEGLAALDGVAVELIGEAEHVADVRADRSAVGLDAGLPAVLGLTREGQHLVASEVTFERDGRTEVLSADDVRNGFAVLAAMAQLHVAFLMKGQSRREALHRALDLERLLAREKPAVTAALQRFLRAPWVDSGDTLALALTALGDATLAEEIDGEDLGDLVASGRAELVSQAEVEARRENGEGQARLARLTTALKWRDRWVTWILGQDRVDVPYSQTAIFELLRERVGEDIDAKRRTIHQLLATTYDRTAEGRNIERLSREIEGEGRMIVCGRISRAFGNQTQLLSNACYVERGAMREQAAALEERAGGIGPLAPAVARLVKLIRQSAPVSHAQMRGAIWHFEEALREYQSVETKAVNARKEADGRRLVGRQGVRPFQEELARLAERVRDLFGLAGTLAEAVEAAPKQPAAFLILQQRFFPGESQLLALANANRDTHPGKIEVLRDLTRTGGHNRYASEGTGAVEEEDGTRRSVSWISKCQHWIEAIPMFIKERIVKVPVVVGGQRSVVERIETEVDQRGMEAFFRFAAPYWAENCDEVMDSEHVALARELLVESLWPGRATEGGGQGSEPTYCQIVADEGLEHDVAALAAAVAESAEALAEPVGERMSRDDVSRFQALRELLAHATESPVAATAVGKLLDRARRRQLPLGEAAREAAKSGKRASEARRLVRLASRRRRPLSTLHILTTESAGMTEGYVQTWIESEIALHNVVRAQGWEDEVGKEVQR